MKKSLSLLMLLAIPAIFFAQSDNTLLGESNKMKITGVFGGISVSYLDHYFDDDQLSIPIDRNGFWGVEIANQFDLSFRRISRSTNRLVHGSSSLIDLKTNGLEFGYRPLENKVIHPMFSVYLGKGKLVSKEVKVKDRIILAQPKVGLELNALKFMKTSLQVGYNFLEGVDLENYTNNDFSRMSIELNLKFGGFWN